MIGASIRNHIKPLSLANVVASSALLLRRWKGGGRPGARPAFSWKEKARLRLQDKAVRPVKFEAYGPLSSLDEGLLEKAQILDLKDASVSNEVLQ
eukprot:gene9729-11940_t